jgi:hypothetical protein
LKDPLSWLFGLCKRTARVAPTDLEVQAEVDTNRVAAAAARDEAIAEANRQAHADAVAARVEATAILAAADAAHAVAIAKATQQAQKVARQPFHGPGYRNASAESTISLSEEWPWVSKETTFAGGTLLHRMKIPSLDRRNACARDNEEIKICMGQAMSMSNMITYDSAHTIDYIENKNAARRFKKCKARLKEEGKSTKQIWVFHGTTQLASAEAIVQGSFKVGGDGDATGLLDTPVWGVGVYSDTNPAIPSIFGKYVLLCKALPGKHATVLNSARNKVDPCPGFDSWEPPALEDPTWRIFRTPEQLLPMYIIHFE